ncbi:hypothetical protein E2P81_ATG01747 [Venturia nashicola]|uniref:Gb n=1 Tax=Venturia nashicola TaxID=86259 RepID=A0A4Z1NEH4_9PEZI|nr:hypothetical protein E6O75_ATG01795 [Venturia nashicola]TLD19019.1 hypothetical protein E2P81_ATG01747 [Venturia nashicola]
MKLTTIALLLVSLVSAVPAPEIQAADSLSDSIALKVETVLAEHIRNIDAQAVADRAIADLTPAIAAALGQYAGTIKKAQMNVVIAAQRAAIEKRDGGGGGAGSMTAAATELRKVAEDVGVSVGTMIGTKIGGTIGKTIGDKLASGAEALPGMLGVKG